MSLLTEKGAQDHHAIGEHVAPNRGPAGGNTGQRSIVRNPESVTPLDVDEANGRGANAGKESK